MDNYIKLYERFRVEENFGLVDERYFKKSATQGKPIEVEKINEDKKNVIENKDDQSTPIHHRKKQRTRRTEVDGFTNLRVTRKYMHKRPPHPSQNIMTKYSSYLYRYCYT